MMHTSDPWVLAAYILTGIAAVVGFVVAGTGDRLRLDMPTVAAVVATFALFIFCGLRAYGPGIDAFAAVLVHRLAAFAFVPIAYYATLHVARLRGTNAALGAEVKRLERIVSRLRDDA